MGTVKGEENDRPGSGQEPVAGGGGPSGGTPAHRVEHFQRRVGIRLLCWGGASVVAGVLLWALGGELLRGVGIQCVAWGVVDATIAVVADLVSRRRAAAAAPAGSAASEIDRFATCERAGARLRRILLVNAGLDLLYLAAGLTLLLVPGARSALWRGHGFGVLLQALFLLGFDYLHAQAVPFPLPPLPSRALGSREHGPFRLDGGSRAALLVHGFPGTPAEMRPLGEALALRGWTVHGVLLPGFGPELASLPERTADEWQERVSSSLRDLERAQARALLIGYSLGGALAVSAAASCSPAALALIAPFTGLLSGPQAALAAALRPLLPRTFQPFRFLDLANPGVRAAIRELYPELDLDDDDIRESVRNLRVPVALISQVFRAGRDAMRLAPQVRCPVLVLQGTKDHLVKAERTERLLGRFPSHPAYHRLDAGHDLMDPQGPCWDAVVQSVLDLARGLR